MPKWKDEIKFNVRYAFAGVLNGVVGLGAIGALTTIGVIPIVANFIGFAAGFALAFFISKKFVFKSDGRFSTEAFKYSGAGVASYLINIVVLQISISVFLMDVLLSQGVAVASYVISMYLASRLYIFRSNK